MSAERLTDFAASETLVVGDMNVDILMGANAGAKTCGVTYGNRTKAELEAAGADYIIDSFEELNFLPFSKSSTDWANGCR